MHQFPPWASSAAGFDSDLWSVWGWNAGQRIILGITRLDYFVFLNCKTGSDCSLTAGLLLRKFSSGKTRTRKFLQCFHPRKTRTRKFSHIFSSGENTHSKSFHPKYFISSSLHPVHAIFSREKFHPAKVNSDIFFIRAILFIRAWVSLIATPPYIEILRKKLVTDPPVTMLPSYFTKILVHFHSDKFFCRYFFSARRFFPYCQNLSSKTQ